MSFDSDSSVFDKFSGKKIVIMFALIFLGAFALIQMIQGFPLKDLLIKESVTEEIDVYLKQGDTCIIDTVDHPREIKNCPYNQGDHIVVTYNKNNAGIESHHLAKG